MNEPSFQVCEGRWNWNGAGHRLTIDVAPDSQVRDLRGGWSLSGIAAQLDGLSRETLRRSFQGNAISVNCQLVLSDGRRVQLVGAFLGAGEAQGLILGEERNLVASQTESGERPGPELDPVYQPIISLQPGLQIVGFEALARWRGAGHGRFDDDGLALNMLLQAADALANWRETTGRDDLFVHVNLTGRDLEEADLPGLIATLIDGHGLAPGSLKVELTEQAALRDFGAALEAARAIKAAGAGLVLDDFGSGHSSFAWLADLPADGLKIDPDLTRRLDDARTRTIVEAVVALAHRLDMRVTAEGIEDPAQAGLMRDIGFDQAQGFAFGRPVGRIASTALLTRE